MALSWSFQQRNERSASRLIISLGADPICMSRATAATSTEKEEEDLLKRESRENKSYYNIHSMQMIRSFKSGAIMCVIIAGVARATRGGSALLRRMMNKRARKFYTHTQTDSSRSAEIVTMQNRKSNWMEGKMVKTFEWKTGAIKKIEIDDYKHRLPHQRENRLVCDSPS